MTNQLDFLGVFLPQNSDVFPLKIFFFFSVEFRYFSSNFEFLSELPFFLRVMTSVLEF